jgi:hypothetical protein
VAAWPLKDAPEDELALWAQVWKRHKLMLGQRIGTSASSRDMCDCSSSVKRAAHGSPA